MGNTEILSYTKAGYYLASENNEKYEEELAKDYADFKERLVEVQLIRDDETEIVALFKDLNGETLQTTFNTKDTIEDAINTVKKKFENATSGLEEKNWKVVEREDLYLNSTLEEVMDNEQEKNLFISYEFYGLPNFPQNPIRYSEKLAYPFENTFHYYLFINKGTESFFQIYKPKKSVIDDCELNRFNPKTSAFCNGNNHLYISGGSDPNNKNEAINDFWDIDLDTNTIFHHPKGLPVAKKNHTMIFVQDQYVFFVGGDDKSTFFYDVHSQAFHEWDELDTKVACPSLCIDKQRFLVCISNQTYKNQPYPKYQITDLRGKPKWFTKEYEVEAQSKLLDQRFSAICPFGTTDFLIVGGYYNKKELENYQESTNNKSEDNYPCGRILFSQTGGALQPTDITSKKYLFKEKAFIQIDDDLFAIIPYIAKQEPKILLFDQGKRVFEERCFNLDDSNPEYQKIRMGTSVIIPTFSITKDNLKGQMGIDLPAGQILCDTPLNAEPPIEINNEINNDDNGIAAAGKLRSKKKPAVVEDNLDDLDANKDNLPNNDNLNHEEEKKEEEKKEEEKPAYIWDDEDLNRNIHNIHSLTDYEKKPREIPEPPVEIVQEPEPIEVVQEPEPIEIIQEPIKEEIQEEPEIEQKKMRSKRKIIEEDNRHQGKLLQSSIIQHRSEVNQKKAYPKVSNRRGMTQSTVNFSSGFNSLGKQNLRNSANVGIAGKRSVIVN